MFKGPNQNIDAIYTASSSAVCGVTLDTNGQEYVIAGITASAFLYTHQTYSAFCVYASTVCMNLSITSPQSPSTLGRLKDDGKVHITLCQFIEPWDALTDTQQKNLAQRYEMGCECKVGIEVNSN